MKIPEVIFIDSGADSTFNRLSQEMNARFKDEDTLILNDEIWKGYVRQIEPEPGLFLQIWDCALLMPILLKHYPPPISTNATFHIVYTLTPGAFAVRLTESMPLSTAHAGANTFFTTNFTTSEFELTPHSHLQAMFISMSHEWIVKEFQNSEQEAQKFISAIHAKQQSVFIFETTSSGEYFLLSEIFSHIRQKQYDDLLVHSRILLLISEFMNKLFVGRKHGIEDTSLQYFDRLRKVEQIIHSYLENKLPTIQELAQMVEMNETTLKKYFKLLFGKTIYEYYLDQKMNLAKRMLVEKSINVSEVAHHLGYEKATNFIDIFKKHYGYSPGIIRKNQ